MRGFAPEVFSVSTVMRHVLSNDGSFGLGTVRSWEENAKSDGRWSHDQCSLEALVFLIWKDSAGHLDFGGYGYLGKAHNGHGQARSCR